MTGPTAERQRRGPIYYASSDRRGEYPQKHLAGYGGILQSDCYKGFEPLSIAEKKVVPITFAFCLAHARRKYFEVVDIRKAYLADRIGGRPTYEALFEIERQINGVSRRTVGRVAGKEQAGVR